MKAHLMVIQQQQMQAQMMQAQAAINKPGMNKPQNDKMAGKPQPKPQGVPQ
jgi:hypothetical protein